MCRDIRSLSCQAINSIDYSDTEHPKRPVTISKGLQKDQILIAICFKASWTLSRIKPSQLKSLLVFPKNELPRSRAARYQNEFLSY